MGDICDYERADSVVDCEFAAYSPELEQRDT